MFYKVDASRVTLREFWWETKLFAWVGILVKVFKLRLRGSTDDLAVDSLLPLQVEVSAIPEEMRTRFEETLRVLQSLGFESPSWLCEQDVYQATRNTLAVLRHSSGRTFARVQCRVNYGRVPAKIKFFTLFVSPTPRGFIVTGNGKRDLAWPKSHDVVRCLKMPLEQVWADHQQRMTAAVQWIGLGEALFAAEEYHASLRDFHLARGVFQPLGEEELALYPTPAPILPTALEPLAVDAPHDVGALSTGPATPPDLMEIAMLAELQKLQNRRVNWRSAIALLVLSAALFVIISRNTGNSSEQNWEFLGIIVGILLFHELGHYLAMKAFGYRNLRMFFIPGFGAAVSGRHYNAPAWKKIIVSLMGPLPGIVVGSGLLFASLFMHNDLIYRIGLLAVIINAFNLIPVLPLDGGWVAHAALFSRHPKLDIGFRIVAALALGALGIFVPGMRLFQYIAIAGLLTLPVSYLVAKIVNELRPVPGLGISPDDQSIPPETARLILAKLRERIKRKLNAKTAALHVTNVFESLNARPPSVGATLGLLTVHASAFMVSFLVLVVAIALHGRGNFGIPRLAAPLPKYAVAEREIQVSGPPQAGQHNVVVISFNDALAVREAMAAVSVKHRVSRFGQTIFAELKPDEGTDQRRLFDAYEAVDKGMFVESKSMHGTVQLSLKMPDTEAGREAFTELQAYLLQSRWGLIPPWASEKEWPYDQRGPQTELRVVSYELQHAPADRVKVDDHGEWKQMAEAQRRGDTVEVERSRERIERDAKSAAQARQRQVEAKYGHGNFIRKWAEIEESKEFAQHETRWKQEIAPLLGLFPAGTTDPSAAKFGAAYDNPLTGKWITCTFNDISAGLPAMAHWLFAHGASDVHYQIEAFPDGDGDADLP